MLTPERPVGDGPLVDYGTLDLLADAVYVMTAEGKQIYCNAAWRDLFGLPDYDEALFAQRLHPDDADGFFDAWRAAMPLLEPIVAEFRVYVGERYRWLRARTTPIVRDARLDGWIGSVVPIDDEREARTRAALLSSLTAALGARGTEEQRAEMIAAALAPAHADYCAFDLFDDAGAFDRLVVVGPPRITAILRESRERYRAGGRELHGAAWEVARTGVPLVIRESGPPPGASAAVRTTHDALGIRGAIIVPLETNDVCVGAMTLGRTRADAHPYTDADVSFYRDIGMRCGAAIAASRVQRELMLSEQRYRALADGFPEIIAMSGPDGRLRYMNRVYREYSGFDLDEMTFEHRQRQIHPDENAMYQETWNRLRSGVIESAELQFRMRRHDGVYRWVYSHIRPIRDAEGVLEGWVATGIDVDERKRAEDAVRIIGEASALFAGTLDTSVALQQLADVITREKLADWCGVYVFDGEGHLRSAALAHVDPARARYVREFWRKYPFADDDPMAIAAREGRVQRISGITQEMYDAIPDPDRREATRGLGVHDALNVPLIVDGESFGFLSLALAESDRGFTDNDERVATTVAQRAAIAVQNARLYERQREVARVLQASFLPSTLPHTADVAFDAVYVAGTRDLTVGGDWYDAFVDHDGTFSFSIGDVGGHGLEAAVPMGKIRQTLRALTVVERDPARTLTVADSVLHREHRDVFVTAIAGVYDPRTGLLCYANAGHPRPFVRAADGAISRLERSGLPLGLGEFASAVSHEEQLAPGDLIVMCTDGLVEATHDIEAGESAVSATLAHPAFAITSQPAEMLRARCVATLPADDVAILTMRCGRGADWSFDANDARAAQAARASFVARLAAAGVPEDIRMGSEIVFGEITGNASRYTPGPIDIALRRDGRAFILCALDRGPGFSFAVRKPDADSESGRGLLLIDALAHSVCAEHIAGFGTYLEITLAT
jgi:PAS domain S-box-containing protein